MRSIAGACLSLFAILSLNKREQLVVAFDEFLGQVFKHSIDRFTARKQFFFDFNLILFSDYFDGKHAQLGDDILSLKRVKLSVNGLAEVLGCHYHIFGLLCLFCLLYGQFLKFSLTRCANPLKLVFKVNLSYQERSICFRDPALITFY